MPVSRLLCEGTDGSPDIKVLTKLLGGRCEVRGLGGKYGMGTRIVARREAIGSNEVFGILDRDFVKQWEGPFDRPVEWTNSDRTILFGWRWERKEIENYLVDPSVVDHALSQSDHKISSKEYQGMLETARDQLSIYQAARAALATSRVRFSDLPSSFGRKRGEARHPFPDQLDEAACRNDLRQVVLSHRQAHVIDPGEVETAFSALLAEFQVGGSRHQWYLHAFAGKDLLWGMDGNLRSVGFASAWSFRDKVLDGIEMSPNEIADWLPEWKALQRAIENA